MTKNYLASIIGKNLSSLWGLRAVILPSSANVLENARGIAAAANQNHVAVDEQPFALVVSQNDQENSEVVHIPVDKTISFRKNNRLFIYTEGSTALHSIDKSTTVVLDQNFPVDAKSPISVQNIAIEITKLVISEVDKIDKNAADSKYQSGSSVIENCLNTLIEAHRSTSADSTVDWNSNWWEHVNQGTANLIMMAKEPNLGGKTYKEFFEEFTFASFGLPIPAHSNMLKNKIKGIGKDIDVALATWWSDSPTAKSSIAHINKRPEVLDTKENHPITKLEWESYDELRARLDSSLLALLELVSGDSVKVAAFSKFTESQFFHPPLNKTVNAKLRINDETGKFSRILPLAGTDSSLHFIQSESLTETSSELVKSEEVLIEIPLMGDPSDIDLSLSKLNIRISHRNLSWSGAFELIESKLMARGRFTLKINSGSFKAFNTEYKISLICPDQDVLKGVVDEQANCSLLFFPDFGPWMLVSEIKSPGKIGRLTYLGPESSGSTQKSFVYLAEDGSKDHLMVASGKTCRVFKDELTPLPEYSFIYAQSMNIESDLEILLDDSDFLLRTKEKKTEIESPLLAAIDRRRLTTLKSTESNISGIRGQLETLFSHSLEDQDFEASHFHLAIPSEKHISFVTKDFSRQEGFLVPNSELASWRAAVDFSAQEDFVDSDFAKEFIKAFNELGILQSLRERNLVGEDPDWVSRTSWRKLWSEKRDELEAYLYSYESLVSAARVTGNSGNVFWAAYPFSASIWDLEDDGTCLGILMSPLHPLRLSWLASVENTLWDSEDSGGLVGAIEGWNLPALGPSPTKNGAFIAVPSDNGDGQLFSGWSYLLSASIDGPESLNPPTKIAGLPAPGSAAGGMNKSSVTSALKDYRRVNPHVTTLTIDLAASSEVSRLRELDEAIIQVSKDWGLNEYGTLPGGLRVHDSLQRAGEVPIASVQAVINDGVKFPLVWSHYRNRAGLSLKCNLRFLQDSGLRIEVEPRGNEAIGSANLGVIATIPLRRFEAYSGKLDDSSRSFSFPTMSQSSESGIYYQALRTFENANARPSIKSQLFRALLVDENADWTVTGESMISPGSIASLLQAGSTQKMLWEWRPPFFESGQSATLEQRPFISIARIPNSFRQQVKGLLSKASKADATDENVESVLKQLGSRGVGLSSLITMGGTHAAGALGFHLALSLVDMLKDQPTDYFVMPLDACDSFLRALAGPNFRLSSNSRADLLLIGLTDQNMWLVPIEIKSYGLGAEAPSSKLPSLGDAILAKAKSQIQVTRELLEGVLREGQRRKSSNPSSYTMWINALSSLVEASIKLSPNSVTDASTLRNRLQSIVSGEMPVLIGNPLVTYFGHEAKGTDGNDFLTETIGGLDSGDGIGLFSVNTAKALSVLQAKSEPSELVDAWLELVDWAVCSSNPKHDVIFAQPQNSPEQSNSELEKNESSADSIDEVSEDSQEFPEESTNTPEINTELEPEPKSPDTQADQDDSPADETTSKQDATTTSASWPDSDGVRVQVGTKIDALGTAVIDFWPGNTALTQMNFGVVGNLGTGKTQFLLSIITQLKLAAKKTQSNPLSFLIFDYKSDYQKPEFLSKVNGEVLKPDLGIPLNVLAIRGDYSRIAAVKKAEAFCDVISKIYANVGPVQKEALIDTIVDLFEDSPNHQAPPLSKVLSSYKQRTGKDSDAVTSVLNKFVRRGTFVEDPSKVQSFEKLIEDKVLVVSLSDFGADHDSKNTLVVLFLDLYYDYMKFSTKWGFEGSEPQVRKLNSFLLVDEATNIMQYEFQILKNLLLEGREYGFGTILASQYLSHFKTSSINYAEALNTWMIHQVPSVTAKQLRDLGIPEASEEAAKRITEYKLHQGYYASLNNRGIDLMGLPFYKLFK